ncbi:hypothetical protein EAO70_00210 [Streptomyces sp. adm13(2018)]|uniref:hypothetical protein n=1 Tax=Streptomyces sp. adm13(2018) TaxID=2479007 RepID=UPI0011CD4689|nr:hypothetical protein [Streptomyces sp. adm13(2018)]TXS32903.1 hypothetical protein EAO70_00210 [Streptomyces sp. adm13(2018)]
MRVTWSGGIAAPVSVGLADAVRFDEVFADGRVYVRGKAGGESMPWSYADRADAEARHMLRAPANDPEYTLRQASMGERSERVGEEKPGGAAVTRYRGLLPHSALTLEMGEETRAEADTLRTYFGGGIPVTVDVWVDGRERAIGVRLSMTVKDVMSSVTTLTLTELGRPVRVVVPAGASASGASVLGCQLRAARPRPRSSGPQASHRTLASARFGFVRGHPLPRGTGPGQNLSL